MTKFSKLLAQASVAAMSMMMFSCAAQAQSTCNNQSGTGGDSPNSVNCGNGTMTNGSVNTVTVGAGAHAVLADGGTAIGAVSNADGGTNTALGGAAIASGEGSFNVAIGGGDQVGFGSSPAANAAGDGSSNIAVGNNANATGDGGGRIAIGAASTASGEFSIAVGLTSTASGPLSTTIGNNSTASGEASVALGAGSVADEDNVVSVGSAGNKRRIVNVADGTVAAGSKDAVNGGQLYAATQGADSASAAAAAAQATADTARDEAATAQSTANIGVANAAAAQSTANTALADAATAQGTADTALENAATAQETADTAIVRGDTLGQSTAAAFGGGSVYDPVSASISAPSYRIGTTDYSSVGAAFDAANTTGLQYFHANSTLPDGAATGANSIAIGSSQASGERSTAIGMGSQASGAKSLAIGDTALASANGAVAVGADAKATGVNAIAIGTGATATGSVAVGAGSSAANGGGAFGDRTTATGTNSAALGADASATAEGAVALGSGSIANVANTVSVGSSTLSRRITWVAAGVAPSDAVNVGQLAASGASIAAALGGGSTANAAGLVSAPSYNVVGGNYSDVGSALSGLSDFSYDLRREARSGIATAIAMGAAPFPSMPGRTSYVANVAEFHGQVAFGLSLAHRLDTDTDIALTAGYSRSTIGEDAMRVGVAGEF